jgi:DNA replicative helicase MCM subunit Mcm2 (Cdc46/Mcm family)
MKKKIALMLVIFALCLGCISCTNAPEDTNEPADDAVNVDDDATAEPQKGFSEITETSEEKFDPDATAQDIEFSYEFRDASTNQPTDRTEYHVGELVAIDGMITNVSDKVLTYTKVRGMFVKLCLYCETDDGRYEMSYYEMKHNTVPPQEVEFVPGRTVVENRYLFYSEDHNAPVGTYHLEISVPGFQQTFYGVLTVVE